MADSDPNETRTPAQHHESTAASRDRAYHLLRQSGMRRDEARKTAAEAVDGAHRARDR